MAYTGMVYMVYNFILKNSELLDNQYNHVILVQQ